MVRKLISITLCAVMLLCMGVPAFAVTNNNEPTETRTVEDILSEYHEKCFAERIAQETDTPMIYSRQATNNGKSFEEETVEELTAAGYEAYNVTGSNYDALEEALNTDFADMGLNRDGSYIIVISGEDTPNGSTNPNSRGGEGPDQDFLDPGGGESFLYYYRPYDKYYTMRYFTITGEYYHLTKEADLMKTLGETFVNNMLNHMVTVFLDSVSDPLRIGTVASLFGFDITAKYSTRSSSLMVQGASHWTRRYIQIFDEQVAAWNNTSYSEYSRTTTLCSGLFYNNSTNSTETYIWNRTDTVYSPYYNNTDQLKQNAVASFSSGNPINDRTGNISLTFIDKDGNERYGLTIPETI